MESIYQALAELEKRGGAGVVCTIMNTHGSTPRHAGSKMLVYPDGQFIGTVGGGEVENRVLQEAKAALEDGKNRVLHYNMSNPQAGDPGICGGQLDIFVEPILPKPVVVIVGAGHVGKAVAHLAKWLDFRVVISDDRPELCTPEENPDGDVYLCVPMQEIPQHLEMNRFTYLLLTTRGSNVDIEGLPALLRQPVGYIGVIGSRRRWITTRKGILEATDITEAELDKVHSPIGLELHAETPEEIAVSILAEIIMVQNGGTGKSMKQ